jgi:CheY-like chemotaxis protein
MDDPTGAIRRETARTRILVVDDDVDSAEMLALALRLEGHDSHAAYDGTSALEATRALRPDAVLLDLTLPDTSGGEVAARIRESQGLRDTIVIAVSGYEPEGEALACFDGHVVKPAESERILELIARAGATRRKRHGHPGGAGRPG